MQSKFIYSCADVRALLGVSTFELKDETILLPVYQTQVDFEVDGVHPKLEATYATIAKKIEENKQDPQNPVPTRIEKKIVGSTQVYATYALALILADSLGMFGLQKIADGKAEGQRATTAQENTYNNLLAKAEAVKDELLQNLEDFGLEKPVDNFVFLIRSAGLATDPVTGA